MWNFVMNWEAEQNSAELSLAKRHWRAEYERGNTPKAMWTHDSAIDASRKRWRILANLVWGTSRWQHVLGQAEGTRSINARVFATQRWCSMATRCADTLTCYIHVKTCILNVHANQPKLWYSIDCCILKRHMFCFWSLWLCWILSWYSYNRRKVLAKSLLVLAPGLSQAWLEQSIEVFKGELTCCRHGCGHCELSKSCFLSLSSLWNTTP